jgi:hypothetical protein
MLHHINPLTTEIYMDSKSNGMEFVLGSFSFPQILLTLSYSFVRTRKELGVF